MQYYDIIIGLKQKLPKFTTPHLIWLL